MTDIFLGYLENLFLTYNKCCSNLIYFDNKETIQCMDLEPPQLINTISNLNNGQSVIGVDINQKERFQDLTKDIGAIIFGKAIIKSDEIEKMEEINRKNRVTSKEKINIPKLDLHKRTRVIKFEEES
ncbi:hypothetical protein FG386_003279 [Cryptosporidium ryanae]|uniref:uncharacterized protein n=1 Tax=Cryptosporidium ryanae TaxID=515981 RepID=UPI003519D890|nr:hypothetical protein FG386_003279 [Cryptosporidium ryanae]